MFVLKQILVSHIAMVVTHGRVIQGKKLQKVCILSIHNYTTVTVVIVILNLMYKLKIIKYDST